MSAANENRLTEARRRSADADEKYVQVEFIFLWSAGGGVFLV